jgi:hypothetical protein
MILALWLVKSLLCRDQVRIDRIHMFSDSLAVKIRNVILRAVLFLSITISDDTSFVARKSSMIPERSSGEHQ